MSVSYGGDKITFDDGTSIASGLSHFRNRVINGDMRIDQRNVGAAITMGTSSEPFVIDRFMVEQGGVNSNAGTAQRISDAPEGFTFSVRYTGGSSSYNSTGFCAFSQRIEGFNVSDLKWGTGNAVPVTLSFWVKSSVIGTYTVNMTHYDGAQERWNNITYTINSANTWEYKTLTFIGDTSFGIANDNGVNGWMRLYWHLGGGSGSATSTTFNSWFNGTGSRRAASGTTNIAGTTNATWQITGVQLEVGSYATTFERRPYGTELALCQRYFSKTYDLGVVPGATTNGFNGCLRNTVQTTNSYTGIGTWNFPVRMRAVPSMVAYNPRTGVTNSFAADADNLTGVGVGTVGEMAAHFHVNNVSVGTHVFVYVAGTASAEL